MMRRLIAGNWKMHGTSLQLGEIEAIATAVQAMPPAADVLICPPSTLIARAALAARGRIAIGAQNCDAAVSGAHTGDVSAQMVKDAGGSWVIVGHSERRQHHGETDAMVAAKAKAAWIGGLLTIICIGETQAQRRAGQALSVCASQIAGKRTGRYHRGRQCDWLRTALGHRKRPYAHGRTGGGSARPHPSVSGRALRRSRQRNPHSLWRLG
jgi:triosephosphate isomerase